MAANEAKNLTGTYAPERPLLPVSSLERSDSAAAFELVGGHLKMCGHTWQIPVKLHWSEDPFEDHEWRRQYQSLCWLAPLRRRANSGDLDARQAWWWMAKTWLESLDRLIPGEATPWRPAVAAVRACELVAGISAVGRQPWLLSAISSHLTWLDTAAEQSTVPEVRILTVAARYAYQHTAKDAEPIADYATALADWRSNHFSLAGAPYPNSPDVSVWAAHVLKTVDSCLSSVSASLPWNGHDHRFAESLQNTGAIQVNNVDTTARTGLGQQFQPLVLDNDQAAYGTVSNTPVGGGFVGFEESQDGSAVDISFAHGGRVWLRGPVPFENAAPLFPNAYSVESAMNAFEINVDRANRHNPSERHRLIHSLTTGVSVWEGQTRKPFDLPKWSKTVETAPDLKVLVSSGSVRLSSHDQAFFLLRLPLPDTPGELTSSVGWKPSFRLYVGPWHARLVDVLHQSGPVTAELNSERLSRLAGPREPDGDLQEIHAGAGWRIGANRSVLRAELSRVPSAGRLVLTSREENHVVTGRGSRGKRGYLTIGDVPDGQYELLWVPVNGSPRRGPRLTFTHEAVALSR